MLSSGQDHEAIQWKRLMRTVRHMYMYYIFFYLNNTMATTILQYDLNPRTAGGLSHLRTAGGGADDRPPPENSKTKKDSDKR